jgi:ribonuclease R
MGGKKRKNKKSSKSKSGYNKLQGQITNLLDNNISKGYSTRQVIKQLKIRDTASKHLVSAILFQLKDDKKVQQLRNGSFKSLREPEYVTGKVDFVNPRFGYVLSDELPEDVWISLDHMHYALDGDKVKVMVFPQHRKGRRPEGRVVEILERGRTEFVGRVEMNPNYAFVVPDNRKMHTDIFVKINDLKNARDNDKVIVEISEWPTTDRNPRGIVTDVLGQAGEHEAEIHSIVAEFGLPLRFPDKILEVAEKINGSIPKSEIEKRRDFRNITTITIDPEDAKDFDDALSLELLPNGNYEVGVHIADVSHYLKEDSQLDKEAYKRATSVYLVDRTIPMLPERLSNNLCSLNPNEDKLTFSAVFELDNNAHIRNEWFGRTIIHSDKRFSYEDAQEVIENVKGPFTKELTILNELALKLRVERFMRGSINFETTEVKFKLDDSGKPLGVIPKERKDAHKMIEDFMLLANKKVAEFINKKGKGRKHTFVYRIHDFPDPERINAFSVFAKKFGHKMSTEQDSLARSLNTLIEDIEGTPEQNVLQRLAIRSMAKAKYTTERSGHFGLAFAHYTHFTSPIRRYPDVMVHRLLDYYLKGGESVSPVKYEEKCKHSSEMEVKASDAERASIKYKQVEYIESVKDREFAGIVSGVTEYGVFVEMVENKCEGMVRVSTMSDDYYEFDEDNYRIIGKRNKKTITLGDDVIVKVTGTDIDRRTIDLAFLDLKE